MQQSITVQTESLMALKPYTAVEVKTGPVNTAADKTVAQNPQAPRSRSAKDSFSRVLGEAQTRSPDSRAAGQNEDTAADPDTTLGGKDLPTDDRALPDAADLVLSLDLNLPSETDEFDGDEAILLATRFVVESLPKEVRQINANVDLRSSGTQIKSELISKLESSMKFLQAEAGMRNVQQASVNPSAENTSKSEATESWAVNSSLPQLKPLNQSGIELKVPVRLDAANWGESVAGRISLMINQRLSSARIHINPPELGPIEVRLNLNSEQASVQFISHSSQVRDALEQSIPRLREMLESAGFSLENSFVGDQSQDGRSDGDSADKFHQRQLEESDRDQIHQESLGLIDQYV